MTKEITIICPVCGNKMKALTILPDGPNALEFLYRCGNHAVATLRIMRDGRC